MFSLFKVVEKNIWYVSDDGSDENDCHTESAPCRNLQTVLDRATDGADIYVTSPILSLDKNYGNVSINVAVGIFQGTVSEVGCIVESRISFKLSSTLHSAVNITCSGKTLKDFTLAIILLIYQHKMTNNYYCYSTYKYNTATSTTTTTQHKSLNICLTHPEGL